MAQQSNFEKEGNHIWEHLNWNPSNQQLEQFEQLQCLLREWNKQVNLTRLIEGNDFWVSQVLDSLWPFKNNLNKQNTPLEIIDVGTGCGLPGLVLAIAIPNSSITLVDSIYKKTTAVKEIAGKLNLISRVDVRTERIELTGQNLSFRNKYDFALARAVAEAPILAEYLIPLLNTNGKAILYKGKWSQREHEELIKALSPLKGQIEEIRKIQLPENKGVRNIIFLRSTMQCPLQYPRSIGVPVKQPLTS